MKKLSGKFDIPGGDKVPHDIYNFLNFFFLNYEIQQLKSLFDVKNVFFLGFIYGFVTCFFLNLTSFF